MILDPNPRARGEFRESEWPQCSVVPFFVKNTTALPNIRELQNRTPCFVRYLLPPLPVGLNTAILCSFQPLAVPGTTRSLSSPRCAASSKLQGCIFAFLPSHIPVYYRLPTFKCFYVYVSQVCLCIEQGILCWIIIGLLVVISLGEAKGISHTFISLMSTIFIYIYINMPLFFFLNLN